jgi:L-threonylcarbamoyladenylate synthase
MIKPVKPDDITLRKAADAISSGRLVAFGTETVYGLGGNACDDQAVARIFAAKGRPAFNPLISHVCDIETAFVHGVATPLALLLAEQFWPGPLTLIMDRPAGSSVSELATAGLDSIAIRVPAKAEARQFLTACGVPVAAPSANRSGRISPTLAEHVTEELGDVSDIDMILDFGPAEGGLESTVIDARSTDIIILRPGSITREKLTSLAPIREIGADGGITSPGQMESHYAPENSIALNVTAPDSDDIHIGFGDNAGVFNLSSSADMIEAAANLYHLLRQADKADGSRITIAPIPDDGLGRAINDRLRRAAASH